MFHGGSRLDTLDVMGYFRLEATQATARIQSRALLLLENHALSDIIVSSDALRSSS
jgi:hypothetical protein